MRIKHLTSSLLLSTLLLAGCGSASEQKETTETGTEGAIPEDNEESKAAMGVGEGNQDEKGGYPVNQGNLYPDSTRKDSIQKPL